MIPKKKVGELISKHSSLEKELSSGQIQKEKFAKMSKEYSNLNDIIHIAIDIIPWYNMYRYIYIELINTHN